MRWQCEDTRGLDQTGKVYVVNGSDAGGTTPLSDVDAGVGGLVIEGDSGSWDAYETICQENYTEDTISVFTGPSGEAKSLAEKVMDAWLTFARTGDPNHAGLDPWPAYDTERRATMEFGQSCQVVDAPQDAERRAWEGIL